MEILKEIKAKDYLCLICHDEITPTSRIWSCDTCFRVFDLKCAQDWSSRKDPNNWKCPHCSAIHSKTPKHYRCWCLKVNRPDVDYARPHSCGQTCGAKRKCPHPCTELCHPGSHPECTAMGPQIKCWCGNQKTQDVCIRTKYDGFSCGTVCGKLLGCRKHKCEEPCHKGKCQPCTKLFKSKCYCGKTSRELQCSQRNPEKYRNFHGTFRCDHVCEKPLNCKNHKCDLLCHPLTGFKHTCTKMPKKTDTCNCGKTLLADMDQLRESCTDPTPNCDKKCDKVMACGHQCQSICHGGPCKCELTVGKTCRCGNMHKTLQCDQPIGFCEKTCGANLSCGRHKCERQCCEFASRQHRNHKKHKLSIEEYLQQQSTEMSDAELAVHLCTKTCGRTLSCGNHHCQAMCHPGQCRRCLEAIHEDYECPCGRTTLRAPIRCGTVLPTCSYPCRVVRLCGHSGGHKCHDPAASECPPCNAMVKETCLCGKNQVSRLCHQQKAPRCVYSCGKPLPCGHQCNAICHNGECPACDSTCNKPLGCVNNHLHSAPCHGTSDCGECMQIMLAKCKCGNLSSEFECGEQLEIFCNSTCKSTEPEYHPVILSIYQHHRSWCQKIEHEMRAFVKCERAAHGFKPMKKSQRRFVHYLAEHYGLIGVSVDYGPNRSVRVTKTPHTWIPKHGIARYMALSRIHAEALPPLYTEEELDLEDTGFSD